MRQPFEIKSQNSLEAANELLQKAFYNSSVHCSYYGVYQFMLHILYEELGRNKQADDAQLKDSKAGGSHEATINKMTVWLNNPKVPPRAAIDFTDKVYHLKRQRKLADYDVKMFAFKEATKLYMQAQSLITFLGQTLS